MKNTIPNAIPRFTYHLSNPSNKKFMSIEADGEVIHWIDAVDKFYELFGYTQDMRKAGVLPEEFIWSEYINNHEFDFSACMQIQIIEYLRFNSQKFLQKYGKQCEEWLTDLVKMRAASPPVCATCKIKQHCSN